jgi:hypothetical protein
MNQVALMPPSYNEKIPADHLVRVVNDAVEKIDLSSLLAQYPGGGTINLSSEDVAEGVGVCICREGLFIAADSESIEEEHLLKGQIGVGLSEYYP